MHHSQVGWPQLTWQIHLMNVKPVKRHALTPLNAFQMQSGAIISLTAATQAMKRRARAHPVWRVKKFATGNWKRIVEFDCKSIGKFDFSKYCVVRYSTGIWIVHTARTKLDVLVAIRMSILASATPANMKCRTFQPVQCVTRLVKNAMVPPSV